MRPYLREVVLRRLAARLRQVSCRPSAFGLIDTGAYQSCIDEQLAQQLQLPLVNQQVASGVGGQITLNVYLAYIAIPALGQTQAGMFTGALLAAGGGHHRALLGRTLLADMLLVYDGKSGSVKLAV